MKNLFKIGIVFLSFLSASCVQKTYKKTVIFKVDVSAVKNIKTVGIRGNKPLDWNYDNEMSMKVKDSVYTIIKTLETGYKFVEIKYTVNGDFELKEKDNRKVHFSENDTTFYDSKFNVAK